MQSLTSVMTTTLCISFLLMTGAFAQDYDLVITNGRVMNPEAYADLLIMEGNPLEDTSVLTQPATNLNVIMKDGKVYKNTLS